MCIRDSGWQPRAGQLRRLAARALGNGCPRAGSEAFAARSGGRHPERPGRPAGAFGVSAPGPRGERFRTGAGTAVTERARGEAPQLTGTRLPTAVSYTHLRAHETVL